MIQHTQHIDNIMWFLRNSTLPIWFLLESLLIPLKRLPTSSLNLFHIWDNVTFSKNKVCTMCFGWWCSESVFWGTGAAFVRAPSFKQRQIVYKWWQMHKCASYCWVDCDTKLYLMIMNLADTKINETVTLYIEDILNISRKEQKSQPEFTIYFNVLWVIF